MDLRSLRPNVNVSNLVITTPVILHTITDFNVSIDRIYESGLNLSHCQAIIFSKSKPIYPKNYRVYNEYYKVKEKLEKSEKISRKVKVLLDYPKELLDNKFIIHYHPNLTKNLEYYHTKKQVALNWLANELVASLNEIYQLYKAKYPNRSHECLFLLSADNLYDQKDSIFNILYHLKTKIKTPIKFFDNKVLLSIADENPYLIAIGEFDRTHQISHAALESVKRKLSVLTKLKSEAERLSDSPVKDIVKNISINLTDGSFEIPVSSLKKIAKYVNISNPNVINNIKYYVENYIQQKGLDIKSIKEEDIDKLIFKAIHYTIHGDDKIRSEYRSQPELLLYKLLDTEYYEKKIEKPRIEDENILIQDLSIIELDRVTAPVRKEYEFGENIHRNVKKLFKILEDDPDYPIEVKDIKWTYSKDKMNRTIDYEITLQNLKGGSSKPYTVKLKVPKLVAGKYFRLNGKDYIMSNQMFFEPVTKTAPNSCRLLSNYSMTTLEIVNLKFDLSDFSNFIRYIADRYGDRVKSIQRAGKKIISVEFKDSLNTTIELCKNVKVKTNKYTIYTNDENKVVKFDIKANEEIQLNRLMSDALYDEFRRILKEFNPRDRFVRGKKTVPYIQIHIQGIKMPLILFFIQQLGLINALQQLNLDFSVGDEPEPDIRYRDLVTELLSDKKKVFIYCHSFRDSLIANGLYLVNTSGLSTDNINDRHALDDYILNKYGTRSLHVLDTCVKFQIDEMTKELLEYKNQPTDLISLISDVMIDVLISQPVNDLNDLRIYRSRVSEVISNLLYKELRQAHARYIREIETGNTDAKLFIVDDWIIKSLLGSIPDTKGNTVLMYSNTFNPITELKNDTKAIKTGPGGIPHKRAFKATHRDIHESHYGNIGANSTTEYQDVGINIRHTLTALINNKYGFYQYKNIKNVNGWELVAADEALVPFINQMDSTRAILATTHLGQCIPIEDPEMPLVSTGANFIIPQICSSKFCIFAEKDGVIKKVVPNKYIIVMYNDGTEKSYDISPRLTVTKRGTFISNNMETPKEGTKIQKGQLVAWTKGLFNQYAYIHGKNIPIAIMNYMGFSHEDGYVVSSPIAKSYKSSYLKEITVIIPTDASVLRLEIETGKETQFGDVLIEFTFDYGVEKYLESFDVEGDTEVSSTGDLFSETKNTIIVKSPGGIIKDIRIYPNKKNMDPNIKRLYNKISKELDEQIKILTKNAKDDKEIADALDNIDTAQLKIGNHKHKGTLYDGTKIVFYIEVQKTLEVGDKLANRFGAKGIVTHIIPEDKTPYGEYTKHIGIFLSPTSLLGRKNIAILKEIYVSKIMKFFNQALKFRIEELNEKMDNIKKLIIDVYKLLDTSKNKKIVKVVEEYLNSIPNSKLKNKIINDKLRHFMIYEPFVSIGFKEIVQAAKLLNIPLKEKVFIPETNTWTKRRVPVGYTYVQQLEQFGKDYRSVRSTGKYTALTAQPVKGRKQIGGQTVSPTDIYALLNYPNTSPILKELLTAKSDDFHSKRRLLSEILTNGEAPEDINISPEYLRSKELEKMLITGIGLKVA